MKITWTDSQAIIQEITGVLDAASMVTFKRDMNIGANLFLTALNREFNRKSRFTNLIEAQQYYQLPEDAHKLKEIIVQWSNSYKVPLQQVADEHQWRQLNTFSLSGQPTHYFIKGYDEVGLYPIPSSSVTAGIEIVFSPRHKELTQDDYTTGTITGTNGNQTITGVDTVWTNKLVGQWLQVTDDTDGNWYRISTVNSATSITIENYYQGTSGGTKPYRIGQVFDLPEEFAEGPIDYAAFRYFLKRGIKEELSTFKILFENSLKSAQEEYSTTTESQVINANMDGLRSYNPFRGDDPGTLT
jgi:hypothetical protein